MRLDGGSQMQGLPSNPSQIPGVLLHVYPAWLGASLAFPKRRREVDHLLPFLKSIVFARAI